MFTAVKHNPANTKLKTMPAASVAKRRGLVAR